MKCSNCGSEVSGNFCPNCGAKVEESSTTTSASAQSTPSSSTSSIDYAMLMQKKKSGKTGVIIAICVVYGIIIAAVIFFVTFFLMNRSKDSDTYSNGFSYYSEDENDYYEYEDDYDIYDEYEEWDDILDYDDDEYLYPTDRMYITVYELDELTREEVALVRNEIYARHGYTFSTEKYRDFFSQKTWYNPNPYLTDGVETEKYFNQYELENKRILVQYEKDMGWR